MGGNAMSAAAALFTTDLPASVCPWCDHRLAAASHVSEPVRPSPGDLSVCISCAQLLVFDAQLKLRKPLDGEIETRLASNPAFADEVRRHQRAIRSVDRRDMR
jgi:hypothetical protein